MQRPSYLPTDSRYKYSTNETEQSSSRFSAEFEAPQRRSFLSVFSHGRSRSADARDNSPPSYESLAAPNSRNRRSKYTSSNWLNKPMRSETLEDALELLRKYDTVILVDDSTSMTVPGSKKGKTRWNEAGDALEALADTAQRYDSDGIDIYFLNNKTESLNMKSSSEPAGSTPTGERLDQILKPHGTPIEINSGTEIKRVNVIVITDGVATDDPKYAIIDAASRLKAIRDLCLIQLGIQFVQVGNDPRATKALKELDDDLHRTRNIRDIVDTTPYSKLNPVTAEGLIKVLLGGINRRIDAQRN
ncbi:hypothetical protein R3P38DRAFT_2834682 [Favolaschia claudopus]|uniref:VWFA domain-containing protein n=1 Tax=Favolaschia claudopus TaxID=2862362 RepID=A0AAW0EDX9_9AGAR